MSVDLQPAELGFRRPFDREVTEILKIGNENAAPVAFKVKTTAPKQYCVRPNSGIIPPNGSVEVSVLLQAMKEEPPLDAKCRDKFLVQSVVVDAEPDANVSTLWQSVEKTNKASIQERKIRVVFLNPSASTPTMASSEDQSATHASPNQQYSSPPPVYSNAVQSEPKSRSVETAESTGIAGFASSVTAAVPTSTVELKEQLAAAQAQISKLTGQLSDPEVRQRKVQEASEKVQTVIQQSNDAGVPLQIVAGLCLLSFLIAYLFF